jgi:hypothetical protein
MALYLISYDIASKDADEYEALWAHLKKIKAVKILYSEWLTIDEANQASAIYNQLTPFFKQADRMLVQELGMNSAGTSYLSATITLESGSLTLAFDLGADFSISQPCSCPRGAVAPYSPLATLAQRVFLGPSKTLSSAYPVTAS